MADLREALAIKREAVELLQQHLESALPDLRTVDASDLTYVRKIAEGNGRTLVFEFKLRDAVAGTVRSVALKQLEPRHAEFVKNVAFMAREAALMHSLDHPCILKLIGVCYEPALPAASLVLEYVEGGTLRRALLESMTSARRTYYSFADAHRWCTSLAVAVAHLHGREPPVLHRDLNPFNIMLTHEAPAKADALLADFGFHATLPQGTEEGAGEATCTSGRREEPAWQLTGQVGAYLYMAPEVFTGARYGRPSDVFALGCCLHEVFACSVRSNLLYANDATQGQLAEYAAKVAEGFRPEMPDSWPPELCLLVARCMAADPASRPSAVEVVRLLRELKDAGLIAEMDTAKAARQPSIANLCVVS